jgi:hypothetical protein
MDTITIQTHDGPKEAKARRTGTPGLVITGTRGAWTITHVASGWAVCRVSIANKSATLASIRDAMFLADSVDFVLGTSIDWTVDKDRLLQRREDCVDWVRSFLNAIAHDGVQFFKLP